MREFSKAQSALVGAVLMLVTAFSQYAPFVGGFVAGFLHVDDGKNAGALAGIILWGPVSGALLFSEAAVEYIGFVTLVGVGTVQEAKTAGDIFWLLLVPVLAFVVLVFGAYLSGRAGGYVAKTHIGDGIRQLP